MLPRRKNQLWGTGATGRPSQKEFEGSRLQGKLLEQKQWSQGADMIKEEAREPDESKKEFERRRMQGKHREQEQESQGTLPRRKNQVRGTGDTGPPPQKEFDRSRMQGKNLNQEQEPPNDLRH